MNTETRLKAMAILTNPKMDYKENILGAARLLDQERRCLLEEYLVEILVDSDQEARALKKLRELVLYGEEDGA